MSTYKGTPFLISKLFKVSVLMNVDLLLRRTTWILFNMLFAQHKGSTCVQRKESPLRNRWMTVFEFNVSVLAK